MKSKAYGIWFKQITEVLKGCEDFMAGGAGKDAEGMTYEALEEWGQCLLKELEDRGQEESKQHRGPHRATRHTEPYFYRPST